MNKSSRSAAKIIFILYLLFLHTILFVFVYEKLKSGVFLTAPVDISEVGVPENEKPLNTPLPMPTFSEQSAANYSENASAGNTNLSFSIEISPGALMIPVVGVKREELQDTFSDSRSEGRVHNAIDIIAPLGTPVVAADDGEIAKFFDSDAGGITIYQYNKDKTLVYYYAHLARRADTIKEKDFVKRGTVIGFVGDTGNAGAGNYHLHFSISRIEKPERYWEGENINPFPLLRQGIEAR
jgi:peptidoglycan LD-endopeptidase LytH